MMKCSAVEWWPCLGGVLLWICWVWCWVVPLLVVVKGSWARRLPSGLTCASPVKFQCCWHFCCSSVWDSTKKQYNCLGIKALHPPACISRSMSWHKAPERVWFVAVSGWEARTGTTWQRALWSLASLSLLSQCSSCMQIIFNHKELVYQFLIKA